MLELESTAGKSGEAVEGSGRVRPRPLIRKGSRCPEFISQPPVVVYFARLGVTIRRVLTDNGMSFRSRQFADACLEWGISQRFTRAYRPQTNGKAERFMQSALREWAYGHTSWRPSRLSMSRKEPLDTSHLVGATASGAADFSRCRPLAGSSAGRLPTTSTGSGLDLQEWA